MAFRTLLIAPITFILCSPCLAVDELDFTDSTCSVSYINEVAQKEGLEKAISFLRSVIISEPKPNGMFWA